MVKKITVSIASLLLGLTATGAQATAQCDNCPSSGDIFCDSTLSGGGGDYWYWARASGAVYKALPNGFFTMTWGCIADGDAAGGVTLELDEEFIDFELWSGYCGSGGPPT